MSEGGYRLYEDFFDAPPLLSIEWHDYETEAVGWLVINSLCGGAAGGGTRMRKGARREEALFLAKTMEVKFGVSGPAIGGGKSVIDFDPTDPRKPEVLARWFKAIRPYLKSCYGTGGDLGVDEVRDVIPISSVAIQLAHPQEGVARGHFTGEEGSKAEVGKRIRQLQEGVAFPMDLPDFCRTPVKVADMVTGYGVTEALKAWCEERGEPLAGRRVAVEGFGAVGAAAAYYLAKEGAKVVGLLSLSGRPGIYRWAVDPAGLPVTELLLGREGANLPASVAEGADPAPFWGVEADFFVPAAASESLTRERLAGLAAQGVQAISCGANRPFAEASLKDLALAREADKLFAVIPDFVANCGMARTFAYLMEKDAVVEPEAILADTRRTIRAAVARVMAGGDGRRGLLGRAFEEYIGPRLRPRSSPPAA